MRWVALLRGINVGGNNPIRMDALRTSFEDRGFTSVSTYIASGNILFSSPSRSANKLTAAVEELIRTDFGLDVPTLLRSGANIRRVAAAIPDDWVTDDQWRSNVIYLWKDASQPGIVDELGLRDGIDEVIHVHDALLWRAPMEAWGRSGLSKLARKPIYQQMTVRNVNTARTLAELLG